MDNLLISVLGHRDSGKSFTWNTLFGRNVRSGKKVRKLYFDKCEYVEVYLVSGSPEERGKYVGELIGTSVPRIVLCSVQYKEEAKATFKFFINNGFGLFVQWLNPGYSSENVMYYDTIGLESWILKEKSLMSIRSGKVDAGNREKRLRTIFTGGQNPEV